jgi:hypothetical protein
MGYLIGQIEPRGPFIDVTIMTSSHRVAALKARDLHCPPPVTVQALIDARASGCAIDSFVISQLGLSLDGSVWIHTPSNGTS